MLRHIYDMPFNDQESAPPPNVKQMDIGFHIGTFLVADEYDVPTLRDAVVHGFERVMLMALNQPQFFSEINNLCRLGSADCRLRELAVAFCVKHANLLFEESCWVQSARDHDKLFGRLLVAVIREDKPSISSLTQLRETEHRI
jgi:hypothetical protein